MAGLTPISDALGALMDREHRLLKPGTTAVAGNVSTTTLAAGAQR